MVSNLLSQFRGIVHHSEEGMVQESEAAFLVPEGSLQPVQGEKTLLDVTKTGP